MIYKYFCSVLSIISFILLVSCELTQDDFDRAEITYKKVLPCINNAWMMEDKDSSTWKFPIDAQQHYEDIKALTNTFINAPIHEYANYEGPWVENLFISKYKEKPLSFFNGFIPIFVQWIDTQILRGRHFDNIHAELNAIIRPDVLYIAISQGDVGLGKIGTAHPNILVLSAGGYGHIPLPLIRGEIPWTIQTNRFEQDIGFFGMYKTWYSQTRPTILATIEAESEKLNMTYKQSQGHTWQRDMEYSQFNLAPRGYGRNSFRFSESIQMGRIPVFIYDDVAWLPYQNTSISIEKYGFFAGLNNPINSLAKVVFDMKSLSTNEYDLKLKNLEIARTYFTYDGLFKEFELFLNNPFSDDETGGHLRCIKHPRTERCCDS
jgi:hypothetical protein